MNPARFMTKNDGRRVTKMIAVAALLGLLGFTWGAAIWASFNEETEAEAGSGQRSSRQAA